MIVFISKTTSHVTRLKYFQNKLKAITVKSHALKYSFTVTLFCALVRESELPRETKVDG